MPPDPAQLCARRDSLSSVLLGPNATLDDDLELMARLLPGGFGGLTTTYIYLKTPALLDSARLVARMLASCPDDGLANLWLIVQGASVRQGQYDWIELRHWYAVVLNDGVGGMYLSDINESINRLSFEFATQAALDAFRTRAQAVGVPLGVLDLTVGVPPVSLASTPPN